MVGRAKSRDAYIGSKNTVLQTGTIEFADHALLTEDTSALWKAAQRLRDLSERDMQSLGVGSEMIDEIMDAAALAEQQFAAQQARIRYLESLSMTDELTGLLNRRGFGFELDQALARARRRGETGLLVLCDLDHFKAINDTYGHQAGDTVLLAVAETLGKCTRQSDYVARLGGDEFAVLLTDSKAKAAEALVAKLDRALNDLVVPWNQAAIPVSASLGFAPYDGQQEADQIFFAADRLLYGNKRHRHGVVTPKAV